MWLYRITAAALGALCEPFLPFTATKLSRILKIESPLSWATISETSDLIVAGRKLMKQNYFAKIEDEEFRNK
jgi:methionyl-tRNA synthetase